MVLPKLEKSSRNREYKAYNDEIRDLVVYKHLFSSMSNREIDKEIIGCDSSYTRGWQSMGILHYLGLVGSFKGIFKSLTVEEAINMLEESDVDDYGDVVECLRRYKDNKYNSVDYYSDAVLISELNKGFIVKEESENFSYAGVKKEKSAPAMIKGRKVYRRNKLTAINALSLAKYSCEIDANHPTFVRRITNLNYTEPHHLVPLSFSDKFDVSLDVEENIVSLCSNCQREIHYGKDAKKLVEYLYNKRKIYLEKAGIKVTIKELLKMYSN